MLKLGLNKEHKKFTPEEAALIELEDVKKMILVQEPKAFDKKAPAKRKAAAKKTASRKSAPKKGGAKKS